MSRHAENPLHMNASPQDNQPIGIGTLMKAALIAAVIAAATLLVVILPAEFNVDPTGLGKKLGLTVLAEGKTKVPADALAQTNQTASPEPVSMSDVPDPIDEAGAKTSELIEVIVPGGSGIEYKFQMEQYAQMTYQWITDGAPLEFDLHGEPAGDTTGYFESYVVASATTVRGSFTAPFDGSHGWYWKNTSDQEATVTLEVEGRFEVIGLK